MLKVLGGQCRSIPVVDGKVNLVLKAVVPCAGSTRGVSAWTRDNPVLRLQGQFYSRCFTCFRCI